jgi:hypothetical protein
MGAGGAYDGVVDFGAAGAIATDDAVHHVLRYRHERALHVNV